MRFLLLLALSATAVHAQSPDRTGFALGARAFAAGLSNESDGETDTGVRLTGTDAGVGLDVRASYGFNRTVSVFFNLGGAQMRPEDPEDVQFVLGVADLGVQFNVLPSSSLNPYLRVALTGQVASFNVAGTNATEDARGGGLTSGVGLLYSVTPQLALDLSLDATGGQFSELVFDGESTDDFEAIDTGIGRLGFGLVYNL